MRIDLPSDDELYAALLTRDCSYEGQAWVAVTTTGVFCRLSCPARKPRRENSQFFASPRACIEAGFRPCKRCQPLTDAGAIEPRVSQLVEAMLANPEQRWSEQLLVQQGLDPSTVRRAFKRQFGTTFLEFARSLRIADSGVALAAGQKVIDAQIGAGFESASGFRDAFARKLQLSPSRLRKDAYFRASWASTPIGPMLIVAAASGVALLEFFDRPALASELERLRRDAKDSIGLGKHPATTAIEADIDNYFAGKEADFAAPLLPGGSEFSRRVWSALAKIPPGTTQSYRELASAIGQPTATRAVARANGANTLAIAIPCHRVIGADGSLTGYGGGIWRKQWLLDHERRHFSRQNTTEEQSAS